MKKLLRYSEGNRQAFIHDAAVRLFEVSLSSAWWPVTLELDILVEGNEGWLTSLREVVQETGSTILHVSEVGPNGYPVVFVRVPTEEAARKVGLWYLGGQMSEMDFQDLMSSGRERGQGRPGKSRR